MKKIFVILCIFFFTALVFAENFSEMSTQELIAIMGYVKKPNNTKFKQELKNRISTMNEKEKKQYLKNLIKKQDEK